MATLSQLQTQIDDELVTMIDDPVGFVYWAYPWGVDGTELAHELGPDTWQLEVLQAIGEGLALGAYRHATVSGHGVGKSALVAWIIQWFMSTRPHPQIPVTANTKAQLDTKTWRELAKWHKLMLHRDRFEWTATKFYHKEHPETWFASSIPWSKDRPEAFAGTHAAHVAMLFDEASSIPDVIYETAEGAMTSPGSLWATFGNGTRNTGRFKETFPGGRFAHRWNTRHVDAREAKRADQQQLHEWIADYGIDSDFVRIRVLGQFPNQSAEQFIGEALVRAAQYATPSPQPWAAKILGVDVARFGGDSTVLYLRQGQTTLEKMEFKDTGPQSLASLLPALQAEGLALYKNDGTMKVASRVAQWIDRYQIDMVFVDVVNIGAGVVDRLHALGYGATVIPVSAGSNADEDDRYFNKRAEMYARLKTWLEEGGSIPADDKALEADLLGPEYGWDGKERLQLERKVDMKIRGLASPDHSDALGFTFAYPVAPPDMAQGGERARQASGVGGNYLSRF